jgi:hypothetical protein
MPTVQICNGQFEGTVYRGPSEGFTLMGDLELQIESSGSVSGVLANREGSEVNVVGQANGRAINLVFNLANGQRVFAVGSLEKDIRDCQGVAGGPLVGPQPGDSGDWGYAIGG